MQARMNGLTKIVVLGESGVGKTSFVNSLCKKAGLSSQRAEMIEVWDIDGSSAHRSAATVFLDGTCGIILVHDLSNRKSESNLGQWLAIINGDRRNTNIHTLNTLMADIERTQIPIIIVGTRLDQAPHRGNMQSLSFSGAPQVNIDCRKDISAGSSQAMAISRFLDAVIERAKGPTESIRRKVIHSPISHHPVHHSHS
uniref:ADP ribosylation factor n=1 Tax=Pristionchus pacificus TaxID=54126 RepID=A0A2A6BYH3_PRIPA|eukprot:PDM70965.1 hypothetical protein PRIPAC_44361 [Pristionchus pacificus]